MKLVELPWGDYVNPERVVGVTVEREGTAFAVHVLTDVEGLHIASGPDFGDDVDELIREVVRLISCEVDV